VLHCIAQSTSPVVITPAAVPMAPNLDMRLPYTVRAMHPGYK
jgi:hypothetical protein